MSLINYAFPDYDDTLPVLEGFSDYSYKNDTCPCIGKQLGEHDHLLVYCDYKNPNKSESHSDGEYYRFFVMLDLPFIYHNPKLLAMLKTKTEVKQFIKNHTIEQFKLMENIYG